MKKGFVVYFDNCRRVNRLADGMCAAVWRVVTTYAGYVAEGREAESWLEEQLAALPPEAAMAAEFMTDTVRRDDRRYRDRTAQYIAAQRGTRSGGSAPDSTENREEMSKYLRMLKQEKERAQREEARRKQEEQDDAWKYVK